MIDDRSDDLAWMETHGYISMERGTELPEAQYAPGVTKDLWDFLDGRRTWGMKNNRLDLSYEVNHTIVRLKEIAARTNMVIGRQT